MSRPWFLVFCFCFTLTIATHSMFTCITEMELMPIPRVSISLHKTFLPCYTEQHLDYNLQQAPSLSYNHHTHMNSTLMVLRLKMFMSLCKPYTQEKSMKILQNSKSCRFCIWKRFWKEKDESKWLRGMRWIRDGQSDTTALYNLQNLYLVWFSMVS